MDKKQSPKAKSDQQRFVEHLEKATEIVRSWPQWKQALLGSAKPVTEESHGDGIHQAPTGSKDGTG